MHLDESESAEPKLSPGIVEDNEVVLRSYLIHITLRMAKYKNER